MSISAKGVVKLYGTQRALDQVSFDIGSGEVVGFLGPNGAGKSTMMKIITCYIPQSQGQVEVCGFDVSKDSMAVRKKVGYLPEHNPLYLEMYVEEYLRFAGSMYKLKNLKNRVHEMVGMVGLEKEKHKKIGALSKGYRQRVGLAQSLIHNPDVLILDEPTSGLDPNQLVDIRKLIKDIGSEKTVMLSTHIMQEVEAICSRVIIIDSGKIVTDNSTTDLKNAGNSNTVTLDVEFSSEVLENELLTINGVLRAVQKDELSWVLETNGSEDARKTIFDWAVSKGVSVLTMQKIEQSLEDVFKSLTGKG